GTGKQVTVSGLSLGGADAGNYSLTQPVLNDGVIAPATLTVTATGVNKVYDAGTTATVILSDDRVLGDVLTLGYTASFSDKNVANGKSVSVSGISITGGVDAGNYTLGNTTAVTT
ncbi:MAG: YDG domain-containing protein, partial [Patescibacteria group bacterium]